MASQTIHAVFTGEPDDRETVMSGSAGGRAEQDLPRQAPRRAADPTAWIHGFHRLRIRWGIRDDIHEAFLKLACCVIPTDASEHWVSSSEPSLIIAAATVVSVMEAQKLNGDWGTEDSTGDVIGAVVGGIVAVLVSYARIRREHKLVQSKLVAEAANA